MKTTIRVAYFNVQSAVGATSFFKSLAYAWKYLLPHSQKPLEDIENILKSEDIDIASFVEVNGKCLRSNYQDQLQRMTKNTHLVSFHFFPAYRFAGIVNQGVGIATKHQMLTKKAYVLPGKAERRVLGESRIDVGGKNVTVLSTHLSLERNERLAQLDFISERIKKIREPVILIGDLNASEEELGPLLSGGKLRLMDSPPTYPSWNPKEYLGRMLFSPEFVPVRCRAYKKFLVADHVPLIAEFKI